MRVRSLLAAAAGLILLCVGVHRYSQGSVDVVSADANAQSLDEVDPCGDGLTVEESAQLQQLLQLQQLPSYGTLNEIMKDQDFIEQKIARLKMKRGKRGPRGRKGTDGTCGRGEPGPPGQDGGPGKNALPGKNGPPGRPGRRGRNGVPGARGLQGKRGFAGRPGRPGLPGKPGISGKPGVGGRNGNKGKPGKLGVRGTLGRRGVVGHRGLNGRTGRTGRKGGVGRRGPTGKRGVFGKPGKKGRTGRHGRNGLGGVRGKAGKKGGRGARGKMGAPGRPGRDKHQTKQKGHIIGMVTDAITGLSIGGAKVFISKGGRGIARRKTEDLTGRYYAPLAPGKFKVSATKTGYYTAKRTVVMKGLSVHRVDIVLAPKLYPGQLRIVTTWNQPQLIVSSYLQTPHKCVVSEKTRKCTDISGAKAVYDYDKCQGHGPETMTIRRFMKGTYNFFLVQDSRWGKITRGRAVVRVYTSKKIMTFRIGNYGRVVNKVGKGRAWCVFKIDGAKAADKSPELAVSDCATEDELTVQRMIRRAAHNVLVFRVLKARGKLKVKKTKSRRSKRRKKAITGVMSGKVINAVNGKGVRGAKITVLRRGVVAKTVRTTSRGMYYIRLVYGAYKLKIEARGMDVNKQSANLAQSRVAKTLILSPKLHRGEFRLVLTWTTTPKDIDSYLKTPDGCVISFRKRFCNRLGGKANLDLDNTHGKGPETITVHKAIAGKYIYYAKQYSRRGSFRASRATVRIFLPNGRSIIHRLGGYGKITGPHGRGRTWIVAVIDGTTGRIASGAAVSSAAISGRRRTRRSRSRRRRSRRGRSRRGRSRRRRFGR